ncbi:tetratricopeptide repeat protein [Candidatus Njordibacter sp. Uisw_058]|uniref:tetratricopeptide repeat protein n=1 Tax=Candidatus Njordibacter sp. Uisw_058 TaxID=3230974 RepID=UPI003D55184B
MELTIKQALQQGIAAHKEGKLEDAERFYRAILQTQPEHPDANHNLGVIAVSVNKADVALSLFKTALEANPKIEQFWLSYIDALIKEQQFEAAKQVLEQAKKQDVAQEKLNALETQLTLKTQVNEPKLVVQKKNLTLSEKRNKLAENKNQKKAKKQNLKAISPSEAEIKSLLEHYENGRYDDADKLAKSITQQFPSHQFAWKVLGALLKQTGRISESLVANQKSVQLVPQDAEAHYNLGTTLQELGRFDEAEASYTQAIVLKPDFATAHYNLGITLKELGRLNEAEVSYKQATVLKPDYALAHSNLGNTLQELGRLDEAEASYRRAIALKPDYAQAYSNLGNVLKELGRLDEAEAIYTRAIALNSGYAEAHNNLGNTLKELGRLGEAAASLKQAIVLKPDYAEAHNHLGTVLQELGRFNEAEVSYTQAVSLKPDYAAAHYNLGTTLQELGRLDEAEASYAQVIALQPDYAEAHNSLLMCFYLLDKQSLFFDKLDYLINEDTPNATIGSLTCRSALKYGVEKPNLFCREPLQYVSHIDMNTQYDFEEIFVGKARFILNEDRVSNRKQPLLVNGYQTSGNLFDIKNSFTEQIQKAIRLEIEKYRSNFKDSKDGLIKKWPTEYSLYSWLISMKSGGELKPHIHSNGWLSGSLYINVPPKSKAESGNLVVSLGEEIDATDTRINVKEIINVVTGSLVLFPASLTHYTIPFEAEEERIVLAFDVKSK